LTSLETLNIELFADGAEIAEISAMAADPLIRGFTTNPTLMRRAGVLDYRAFAREALSVVEGKPISFEVLADDFDEMREQALEIASWGENVFVKIPISNCAGQQAIDTMFDLTAEGVRINATALMTVDQVKDVAQALADASAGFVSLFAGRIADTGRDPVPMICEAADLLATHENLQLIWASPREILNIFHAEQAGCDVITVTRDLIEKLHLIGKDLVTFSQETVQMFFRDAQAAGYRLEETAAGVESS
jgi:transaldolase